jgi:hypothetical protein
MGAPDIFDLSPFIPIIKRLEDKPLIVSSPAEIDSSYKLLIDFTRILLENATKTIMITITIKARVLRLIN